MAVQLFIILLVSGLVLVGAEIFVPGGVLGLAGGLALLIATGLGFAAFGPTVGAYVALGIVALVGTAIFLWIRFFPGSKIGRLMTVSKNLAESKGTQTGLADLQGAQGEASSDLRPAGFATIGGRRIDVVTEGGMVTRGTRVRVVDVEGNRVVVAPVEE